MCKIEKHINNFYKIYSECKDCNIKKGVKRYYDNNNEISVQQKIYYEKNRDKLLQKQNDYRNKRYTDYKELLKSYVELQNKIKNIGRKVSYTTNRKLNRFVIISKWHSLTTYTVKSVIDLLLKNNGINISLLEDICIEKSMVIG